RSATMPSCCGITPGSVLCTGSPPARSRSWSVEPPPVAVAPHSALRTRRATAPRFLLRPRSEPCVPSFSARLAVAATLCSCGLMRAASAQRLDAGAPPPPAPLSGSTVWELTRELSFGSAAVGGDASGAVGDALGRLLEGRSHESESSTLMSGLLNGYVNGFFYGHVKRAHGEDLMFQVDPEQPEQI